MRLILRSSGVWPLTSSGAHGGIGSNGVDAAGCGEEGGESPHTSSCERRGSNNSASYKSSSPATGTGERGSIRTFSVGRPSAAQATGVVFRTRCDGGGSSSSDDEAARSASLNGAPGGAAGSGEPVRLPKKVLNALAALSFHLDSLGPSEPRPWSMRLPSMFSGVSLAQRAAKRRKRWWRNACSEGLGTLS